MVETCGCFWSHNVMLTFELVRYNTFQVSGQYIRQQYDGDVLQPASESLGDLNVCAFVGPTGISGPLDDAMIVGVIF